MIDRDQAIAELAKVSLTSNEEGLMPEFNVLVNFLPSYFWNTFSEKMLKMVDEDMVRYQQVSEKLESSAANCGYHTGYGIITSEVFNSIVGPMIQSKPDDVLHGAYAVFTAWGWADARITELSKEKMVIRIDSYYEGEIRDTYAPHRPFGYMVCGVSRAFMDIAYGKPYPNGFGTYQARQTKAIELGDEYSEVVVTLADKAV